jgi:hypothetical protein
VDLSAIASAPSRGLSGHAAVQRRVVCQSRRRAEGPCFGAAPGPSAVPARQTTAARTREPATDRAAVGGGRPDRATIQAIANVGIDGST